VGPGARANNTWPQVCQANDAGPQVLYGAHDAWPCATAPTMDYRKGTLGNTPDVKHRPLSVQAHLNQGSKVLLNLRMAP